MALDGGSLEIPAAPTLNAVGGFDIFPSAQEIKQQGWRRFQHRLPELTQANLPTSKQLFRIHELITPDVAFDNLQDVIKEDMKQSLVTLDRPDTDRVFEDFLKIAEKDGEEHPKDSLREHHKRVRHSLTEELLKTTKITLRPQLKGGLRTFGDRSIQGYPEERNVPASHMLIMASDAEMMMLGMGVDVIYPTAYYGLSVGLPEVYAHLCDTYDAMKPASRALPDLLLREAFFQVLGTRLLHPFWDGNGRAFTGHLAAVLTKENIPFKLDKLQQASNMLGYVSDSVVELTLKQAKLSLVSDMSEHGPLHLLMLNPFVREDYMTKLRQGITSAIELGVRQESPYSRYIQMARDDLVHAIEK